MDHQSACEILRLDRLERAAQQHQNAARQLGDMHRQIRGAALEMAAHDKMTAAVLDYVSSCRG